MWRSFLIDPQCSAKFCSSVSNDMSAYALRMYGETDGRKDM